MNNIVNYEEKYLKYKIKYLKLKGGMTGGTKKKTQHIYITGVETGLTRNDIYRVLITLNDMMPDTPIFKSVETPLKRHEYRAPQKNPKELIIWVSSTEELTEPNIKDTNNSYIQVLNELEARTHLPIKMRYNVYLNNFEYDYKKESLDEKVASAMKEKKKKNLPENPVYPSESNNVQVIYVGLSGIDEMVISAKKNAGDHLYLISDADTAPVIADKLKEAAAAKVKPIESLTKEVEKWTTHRKAWGRFSTMGTPDIDEESELNDK